jgi:hypothetical protein
VPYRVGRGGIGGVSLTQGTDHPRLGHTMMQAVDWYRLGDGYLSLQSEHAPFRDRFERLFCGCRELPTEERDWPAVRCTVATPDAGDISYVRFADPAPLDVVKFAVALFGDRGCREVSGSPPGQRSFGFTTRGSEVLLTERGDALVANNHQSWEWLVGNIAVHRLVRLQSGVVVLHGASVSIGGAGLLLVGPKGSGKTTVSLALAARGHGFLGDEMAALRLRSFELVPVRRTTSIRSGVRSSRIDAALRMAEIPPERFPDGASRVRARIEQLFPASTAGPVPLSAIVLLRGLGTTARLEPFMAGREHLKFLTPLPSTLWTLSPAERAMRLLGILPRARCYWLDVGEPEATADLLEHTVDAAWV